jgi:hypothetical protein
MAHHDTGDEVASARKKTAVAVALLALSAAWLGSHLSASVPSFFVFAAGLALFVAPGLALGGQWFTGIERILIGSAVGYFMSTLVVSGLYRWGFFRGSFAAGACLAAAGAIGLWRRRRRATSPKPVTSGESSWCVAAMILAVVLVALPFSRVGETTTEGIAYRAYFSADLMTHLSVVAELQKGDYPPQNPFYAGEPLGYYWLFFVFPALVGRWTGNQEGLLLTYLAGGILFAGLAFSAARRVAVRPGYAFIAVVAGLVAASWEGLAVIARAGWLGEPLGSFKDTNLDAFSRWVFGLTSLDGLHRSLLYTPQHLFSYSLLLVLVVLVLRGEPRGVGSSLFSGALLGGMAGTSIVTAMLAGPWLVWVRWSRGGSVGTRLADLAVLSAASLACLGWYFELGFFGDAGSALTLRWPQLPEIPALVVFECGPLLLLAAVALARPTTRPFSLLAGMALLAILFLDIRGYEGVWMAWRAGSVFLISLMLLAAAGVEKVPRKALVVVLVSASLTAALDLYNAQDIENRRVSRGDFRWTTVLRHTEAEALKWVRSETDPRAVVQWDVRARDLGEWAMIPAIGERRMAVGFPVFLLEPQKYRRRERRYVRPIFLLADPDEAHRRAREAGIDYLFIGRRELEVRGDGLRGLWEAPERFRKAYSNKDVTVFEVLPEKP